MAELPSGTVTFLLTDVEGSTARWERETSAMAGSAGVAVSTSSSAGAGEAALAPLPVPRRVLRCFLNGRFFG